MIKTVQTWMVAVQLRHYLNQLHLIHNITGLTCLRELADRDCILDPRFAHPPPSHVQYRLAHLKSHDYLLSLIPTTGIHPFRGFRVYAMTIQGRPVNLSRCWYLDGMMVVESVCCLH